MLLGRKLPIGIQDFESLRKNEYMYVDKTEYIYRLVNSGKPYAADQRTLLKIGVNFDSKERSINGWEVR